MSFEGLGGNTESDQHNMMDYKIYDQNVNEMICKISYCRAFAVHVNEGFANDSETCSNLFLSSNYYILQVMFCPN